MAFRTIDQTLRNQRAEGGSGASASRRSKPGPVLSQHAGHGRAGGVGMDEVPHDLNAALVGMDESGSRSPPSQSRPREVSPTKVPAARRRTKVEKLPPEKAATVPGPVPMQHSERPLRYERLAEGQPVEEARSAGASEESRGARVKKLSPGRSTLSVAEPPATRADGHSPAHSARSAKSSRVSPTSRGTRTSPTRLGHRVEEHRVEDMFLPPKQHSAGSVAEPRQESQAAQEFLTDGEEHESERGREAPVQRPKPKRVKPLSSSTSTSPLAKRIEPLPSSTSTSPLVKRIESLSSSTSGRGPIPAAPAVQDLSGAEKERAERDLDAALRACRGGVVWPHVRLMVRGGGGEGKTSTIGAMSGKTFEASQKSTVGAGTLDVELRQEALEAGGGSGCPLQPHQRVADEYVAALAGQAAEGAAAPAASMLDAPRAAARAGRGPAPGAAPPPAAAEECVVAVAPDPSPPPPCDSRSLRCCRRRGATTAPAALSAAPGAAPPAAAAAVAAPLPTTAAAGGPGAAAAGEADAPEAAAAPSSPPPAASKDLVVRYAAAMQHPDASKPKLVFRVQDTGGQPVFVQLVERLMSSAATVYMVVFSIPKLLNTFPAHSKKVTDHLLAIAAFAQDAPLLLVGTRKGEASEAELKSVSDQLRLHIEQHCPPSVARMALGGRGVDGMCFFAVENSQGYAGDDSIRELVQALERAAASLPSMRQRVPLAWLQVYDALRRLSERQRHVPLGRVRELAEAHGMPHRGLTLEQEVASRLQFFHSLNAVLWWGDVPDLAGLVILDPQWMIDAASCFIRDFGLHDHTEGWEKMRLFDERARREELAAWKELTQGSGILHRCVLDILWQSQDFSQHRQELLLLMRQFGLLVPLPNRADQYLVPALLDQLDPAMAHAPAWRALLDAPKLLVHFALAGQGRAAGAVVLDAADLSAGFAPAAVFSRFCTAALACGAGAAEGWVLRQDRALVTFGHQPTVLAHDPSSSGIYLHFDAGQGGSKGIVVDFIRVLLAEDLSSYPNLTGRVLVPLPGDAGKWVNLEALPGAPAESLPSRDLKEDLGFEWFTTSCDFFFVRAARLKEASDAEFPRVVTLQEMRSRFPDWIERRTIDFYGVVRGDYRERYLAVSHRWEDPEHPDTANEQLKALKRYLVEHPDIDYVFYDFFSLPQGGRKNRTLEDNAAFYTMLANMVFVYLGARVLVLLDYAYMGRFWTRFEAWVAMACASVEGLQLEEGEAEPRCDIRCIHGAHVSFARALRESYAHEGLRAGSAAAAVRTLAADSVQVTNGSDKSVQLGKIPLLDVMVRRHVLGAAAGPPEAPGPPAALAGAKLVRSTKRVKRRTHAGQEGDRPQVEGLAALLLAADLSDSAAQRAWAWCKEEEVTRVSDILSFEDDFVAALQLKRVPERRLRDALRAQRAGGGGAVRGG